MPPQRGRFTVQSVWVVNGQARWYVVEADGCRYTVTRNLNRDARATRTTSMQPGINPWSNPDCRVHPVARA